MMANYKRDPRLYRYEVDTEHIQKQLETSKREQ